jgi:hypothetical protein
MTHFNLGQVLLKKLDSILNSPLERKISWGSFTSGLLLIVGQNIYALTIKTEKISVDMAINANDSITTYLGIGLLILSIFTMVYADIKMKFLQVEDKIDTGYEKLILENEKLIGNYSKTIAPTNFIYRNQYYYVLSSYYNVEEQVKNTIRIDSFTKDGKWNEKFGFNNSGFRLITLNDNNVRLTKILALSNGDLIVIGTESNKVFLLAIDKFGHNKMIFNNDYILFPKIDNEFIKNCTDALIHSDTFYLLCQDITNVGNAIIAINKNGNFKSTFGNNGVSEGFQNTYSKTFTYDINSNSLYVAGKGILFKYFINGRLDAQFSISSILLHNGFINQINDITSLSNGTTLTVGCGNNGFVAAIKTNGEPDNNIGNGGRIDVRSFFRVQSSCVLTDNENNIIVGGSESNGNGLTNAVISFFCKNGKPKTINNRQSIHINLGRSTSIIDMKIVDNNLIVLIENGTLDEVSFCTYSLYRIKLKR